MSIFTPDRMRYLREIQKEELSSTFRDEVSGETLGTYDPDLGDKELTKDVNQTFVKLKSIWHLFFK